MSGPDIFFSYAREDETRVAPVVAALEACGWSVFWDRRIPAGKTWRSYIGRALDQAQCVVVAWSDHSINSNWVLEEADEGMEREILVPILLDAVRPPRGFRGIQAADLSDWSSERPSPAFDSFLVDLGAVLGPPQPGPSTPSLAAESQGGADPVQREPVVSVNPLVLSDGDEPTAPQQGAAMDSVGGAVATGSLADGKEDDPYVAETPVPSAGQPVHAIAATARREVEVDPAPIGSSQSTHAPHPARFDAVLAEQARSSIAGRRPAAGRWWLGIILVVGAISAGYVYLGLQPTREPAPDVAATPVPDRPADNDDAANQSNTAAAPVTDCDRLAALPNDGKKHAPPGVNFGDLDAARAVPACEAATARWPQEARFAAQYGRALEKAGRGVEAVPWYRKAANQGDAAAQNNLGVMYENGRGGLAKDEVEAVRWYRKAADQGYSEAQVNLGRMYENGRGGLPKDPDEARRLYKESQTAQTIIRSI
jgi:hypothetical protein